MRPHRRLLAATVLLATAFAGTPALISSADAVPDPGERSPVSRAAQQYGMSEAELRGRLRADPDLRVSGAGLFYVDPAPTGEVAPTQVVGQAFPLEDTFELHSKPGSQRTIYLDFNGHDVSGTWWNEAPINLAPGSHPAWTLDGDPGTFNDAERTTIQDVFLRVAEDYGPFDVDVTTEDPGAAAIIRNGAGDQVYGTRALITPSASAINTICGGGCGGVAFLDVFDAPDLNGLGQPAFVFPQALGPNVGKFIADATTHEVGHNFSLMHDGTSALGYYEGHSSLWGPIMGAPYDYPVTQFALNDYPSGKLGGPGGDPDGWQPNPDDLATISGNGTSFRADEAGNSVATAGAVPAGSAFIHNRTDVDYYNLGTCSGTVTVAANNAEVSPNLDIELQLLNPGGTSIDTDNPTVSPVSFDIANGMDATVSASGLASGTYFVRVDGVAPGNTFTAYDDYGSVGAYALDVTGCNGVVDPVADPPSAPLNLTGDYLGAGDVELSWSPPADDGGAPVTGYDVYMDGGFLGTVPTTGAIVDNVPTGEHDFGVAAVNSEGPGPQAHVDVDATDVPEAKPGKPRIGKATQGKRGGKLTAKVSWQPPSATPNPAISGYQVVAYRENNKGKFVKFSTSQVLGAGTRGIVFTTNTTARLKFAVKARNALGFGSLSSKSNAVRPR